MQTLKNPNEARLSEWPQTREAWAAPEPVIKFTVDNNCIVQPGDRILAIRKMRTSGQNSGSIMEVYYYVQAVKEVTPNPIYPTAYTDITATAKRYEV
jgi:hypothetical protein